MIQKLDLSVWVIDFFFPKRPCLANERARLDLHRFEDYSQAFLIWTISRGTALENE